mmetsp:Transcript_553/g.722  ORF Transcript_553/g.722 Transcript_553/m.722 type:complete len:228 (-) Transcript_553:222-905(-)|eukprot:CAMPEP_0117757116 /NCGR_PEP_ID=MMETSP0947-20121206/14520_1 /TAXON_ID=44440 /ORGANISM="Chattonella subsalsa, Strain CCMP2191" /LENGTH=227 /DNA_ID=CAMNT_0005576909 /DNA_START=47 /DNA_END=730 /DNA_ORIENTATION=+
MIRGLFKQAARAQANAACAPLNTKFAPVCIEAARKFSSKQVVDDLSTQDHYFEKDRIAKGENKREFTYFMLGCSRFIYASAARLAAIKFISSMSASADVLALASVEVDLSPVEMGKTITIKWRGKPIFIRRRTEAEISESNAVAMNALRDPETDQDRTLNPEWMVLVGICTHLGCVPLSGAGEFNGWFCPCHGSHYDVSGRIRLGPAPLNMEIPPYKFVEDEKILIG